MGHVEYSLTDVTSVAVAAKVHGEFRAGDGVAGARGPF